MAACLNAWYNAGLQCPSLLAIKLNYYIRAYAYSNIIKLTHTYTYSHLSKIMMYFAHNAGPPSEPVDLLSESVSDGVLVFSWSPPWAPDGVNNLCCDQHHHQCGEELYHLQHQHHSHQIRY